MPLMNENIARKESCIEFLNNVINNILLENKSAVSALGHPT